MLHQILFSVTWKTNNLLSSFTDRSMLSYYMVNSTDTWEPTLNCQLCFFPTNLNTVVKQHFFANI